MKFIGHLDIMRYFQKAMRRAGIPIAFTSGYSPHMIMSFANPLGVGLTSEAEYFDIELKEPMDSKQAVRQLNAVMVEGIKIINFVEIDDDKKKTGMSIVAAADYLSTEINGVFPIDWEKYVISFMKQSTITILKKTKKSERDVDIRPMIYDMEVREECLFLRLATGSVENLKPELVMQAFSNYLGVDLERVRFTHHRLEVFANIGTEQSKEFVSLESLGRPVIL